LISFPGNVPISTLRTTRVMWMRFDWLQILRPEARVLCDPGKHPRPDLLPIVECEDKVRPAGPCENPVGTGLPFDRPSYPEERS
jgi:hypothetical protein